MLLQHSEGFVYVHGASASDCLLTFSERPIYSRIGWERPLWATGDYSTERRFAQGLATFSQQDEHYQGNDPHAHQDQKLVESGGENKGQGAEGSAQRVEQEHHAALRET